jgi:hypothetical protein
MSRHVVLSSLGLVFLSGCSGVDPGSIHDSPDDTGSAGNGVAATSPTSSSSSTLAGSPTSSDAGTTDAGPGGATDAGDASTAGGNGAAANGVQARSASSFLATLGVCTHIGQGVDDPTRSATALAFAGFHNLRDDGVPSHVPDWINVYRSAGVKTDILTNDDLSSTMSMADQLAAAGALLSVEGANEPNNFPVTYNGQTASSSGSFAPVAALQRDIYAAVKADKALAGIRVFHSSEAGGSEPDNQGLQFLKIPSGAGALMPDGTLFADYANTHNYVCGHSGAISDNVAWNAEDPTLNGDWDGMYVEYGHTWNKGFSGYATSDLASVPRVTTETGWTTSGSGSLTLDQQGKVLTNLFLSAFARGWSYTFVYMLRDDPSQGYWGFFDTSYAPKPSGTFLHNLTTILADDGASATQDLPYTIAGEPTTVHDLLLQKSSGQFELVVWDEKYSGGSDAVTVQLGSTVDTVRVYDPTVGTGATQTLSKVSSVSLSLTDHPQVIEL